MPSFIIFCLFVASLCILYLIINIYEHFSAKYGSKPRFNKKEKANKKDETKSKQGPDNTNYSEIESEIQEVVSWIGVSEKVNTSKLFEKVLDGKEKEAINEIAVQLSLPMKITISHVKEPKKNDNGTETLAEVKIGNIPRYGSKYLKNYPCHITLYGGYDTKPDRFIYVITHELCHYVLQSIRPRLQDSDKEERLTDLAVIFSGFENAYRTGSQSHINGNAGYYINKNKIDYICSRYESILARRKNTIEKIYREYDDLIKKESDKLLFMQRCNLMLKHKNEWVDKDDIAAIGRCFSNFKEKDIESIAKIQKYLEPLHEATRYGEPDPYEKALFKMKNILNHADLPNVQDINILMKYSDTYYHS